MKVRIRKKYPEGGNLSAYPHPKSFLNPVQRDYHIFQPQRSYTPGQNAASGRASNAITDEIIMAMLPLPPVAKGIQAGVKGYRALKAAGKAEEIAAEIAAKQAEQDAKAAVSKLTTQTLKGRQPLITKRQLNAYDDPTRPHTSIPAAIDAMDRGAGVKDIWNAEDVIGKNRENTIRELITEELKNNPKSFVRDLGRPDLANLPDDKIRSIINVNDEVRRHLKDTYYKETRQKLKGIDAYQQLTVNKHGGKIKKRNYTPTNMEGFHQANDANVTSGPFLQRNGMSFPTGGTIAPYITKDPNDPRIQAYRDSSSLALMSYRETEKSKKDLRAEINTMDSLLENRLSPLEKATLSSLQATQGRFSYKPEYSQYFIPNKEIKEDLKKGNASKMGAAYIVGKGAIKGKGYGDALFMGGRNRIIEPSGYNVIGDDRYITKKGISNKTKDDLTKDWTIPEKFREYLKSIPKSGSSRVYPSIKGFLNYETGKKYFEHPEFAVYDVIPKFEFPKQQVILQKDKVPAQTLVKELHTKQPINNQVKSQKKIVSEQVQIPQEMPKDTVRVPSTPPIKKLVQTKYMDARPYYQEEQMRDYDKTGKLDSAKIDAHKRWLKEQGTPNRDTNLLPVKHPYGGNISSLGQPQNGMNTAQLSQSADQGISMIPGFGQFYGLAKGAADTGRGMIKKDTYGVAKTNSGAVADSALTSTHQQAIDHFGRGETGAGIRSIFVNDAIVNAFDPSSINKRRHEGNRLQGIANTNGFQDSGFMANGGLLNIDPQGRVVTSRYDQGGNIRRIQGGIMHDEGYGIEHAYGASHEQGGMDYAPNAEIQGNEKVLDGEYVITDEPGSELDKTQMSISRRLDKNTKALSSRNNGDQMKMATDKLKNHAIQQNEEYLTARNNERDSKLRNAIRRAIKKYGGDLETLDAEMDQMRRGGGITSRGSKWILGGGTGDKKLSDYGADPSVFAADYMSGNAYAAQRAGINPSSSVAYMGAPMANYGQKMFANNDAYSGYRGYDGLPGYGSMAAAPPNVNLNNTGTTYGRWESDRNSTPPPPNKGGNWANTAMDLAPVIANTIAGLSKADKVQANKYYTKYMTPDLMKKDFEPIRRGIAGSQYGLRNSGMYSRAGQASIAAQGAKAMGDYSFNVDQANTGIKNQFKGLNSQIETGNRGIDWQSDMFNFQAKDARRNYLMQAAGDLSKYSQNKQNYNRDQEFLEMAYPEYARIMRSKRG